MDEKEFCTELKLTSSGNNLNGTSSLMSYFSAEEIRKHFILNTGDFYYLLAGLSLSSAYEKLCDVLAQSYAPPLFGGRFNPFMPWAFLRRLIGVYTVCHCPFYRHNCVNFYHSLD